MFRTATAYSYGLRLVALFCLTTAGMAAAACGSSTSPSEEVVQDNLSEAPDTAHTVSTSDLTIKFWLDVSPSRNTAITPGTPVTWQLFCRHSRYIVNPTRWVHLAFEHIVSNGSVWPGPITPFGESKDVASYWCSGNGSVGGGNAIPAVFPRPA